MGDTGDGSVRDEIDAIVGRISELAFADERLGRGGPDAELAAELGAALEFLPQLRLRTLRALEKDLARPDSLATGGLQGRGQAGEPGVARFLVQVCSQTPRPYSSPRPAHVIDASLLDLLIFRDVRLAHGSSMFHRCFDGVKAILGLGSEDSLAEHGVARYGARGIVSLLHISVSLADLQLSQTSAHITPQMGYAGMDAWADAQDDCHSMTAAFARWILKTDPSPAKVVALAANGRLAKYGISPDELDPEKVRAELAKVDVAEVARSLSDVDAGSFDTGPVGSGTSDGPQGRRPDLSELDDGAMRSFDVTMPPTARNPATAGDAFEKHISRRESNFINRRLRAVIWIACPLAVVAISLWMAGPALGEHPGGRDNSWKGLAAFFLAEALGGCLIAMGISSWLDLRVSGFFLVARELSRYTVLQGRRDKEFLQALRVLRPGLFERSATAGLPRLFTVCFDKEGALLLGGDTHASVVAAFHWLHVRQILAEPPVRGRQSKRGTGQRVVLLIRQGGTEVRLAFPLERAKVAWTSRTSLEADPVKATLGLIQGMRDLSSLEGPGVSQRGMRNMTPEIEERMDLLLRRDAVLEGTEYENEALEYERRPRPPLAPAASAFLRDRRGRILRGVVVVALLCAAGPSLLMLILR